MVAVAGPMDELQKQIGDKTNSSKVYQKIEGVWCSPMKEFAEAICESCGCKHYVDTACDGKPTARPDLVLSVLHSKCPPDMGNEMIKGTLGKKDACEASSSQTTLTPNRHKVR